ncbi:hypothetical protein [Cyanobacterium aponinum]|nr:hypothetical protein [Cyanobacterium aponinum]MTF37688.1 hypothetical protein [Cyanobacterium aponinum 0216]
MGVWIPALALVDYDKLAVSVSSNILEQVVKLPQDFFVSVQKKAEQDITSLVDFADNLAKNINNKVASDIQLINSAVEKAQKLIEKTTQEIAKSGENSIKFINQYLAETNSAIGKILNQISDIIQNFSNETFRKCIAMAMKVAEDSFDSAKKVVDKLRQEYPKEKSFKIAQRLINRSTIFSLGFGIAMDGFNFAESLTKLSIGLDLAKNAALLSELVYQIGIAYGFNDINKITKGEAIAIIALCLGIDILQQLGLKALTEPSSIVSIPIKAVSNVALFQLVGYASCLYFDIKVNGAENPLVSGKAYQQFTDKLRIYLDETLSETEKLADIVKDAISIKQQVPALATA